jgi:membrane protein DedA with SNARE-associated domain
MEHFLQTWGYVAIFGATLISSMCIPIGSEVAIAYGGVLASGHVAANTGHDHLSLVLVIVVATVGELIGSFLGYGIGYFGGRPLVDRVGKFVLLTHKDLDRAEEWFNHRGEWAVLFTRFIPLVRSFISLAAGLGEMALGKFAVFTVIGCAAWCAALASIGYSLGSSYQHVINGFSYAGYIAIVLVVLAIIALLFHRLRVVRAERAGVEPGRKGAHSRR